MSVQGMMMGVQGMMGCWRSDDVCCRYDGVLAI